MEPCDNDMTKKITIMLEDDLDKKLRELQGKAIKITTNSISYSKIINEIIRNTTSSKKYSKLINEIIQDNF